TAPKGGGRGRSTGRTSRPPPEAPMTPRCSRDVYLFAISHSPAAMKSSNPVWRCTVLAALCHASPYSPPPRTLTSAVMPPRSSHATAVGSKYGSNGTPPKPYAVIITGRLPSSGASFFIVMNIGTLVPSLLAKNTCLLSNIAGSNATFGGCHDLLAPVARSKRYAVAGIVKLVNV